MATKSKEFFHIIGEFKDVEGKRRFIPNSPKYYRYQCSKMPLSKQFCVKFTANTGSRSSNQLRYYWCLLGLISDHTGHTSEELHDFVMRAKFGTKTIKIGNLEQEIRMSIADDAHMTTSDCVELIMFTLEICRDLEIVVPSKEELGY